MLGGPSEYPELWAFLESLRSGEDMPGVIAAIDPFGVFVALDDGPAHPVFPGVGFIIMPELSWSRFENAADVVHVGQRVSCEFLQFDTWNLEARLSLRAKQPDPFQAFAEGATAGRKLAGQVTWVVPIGAFVRVADGVEGLVPARDLVQHRLEVGDELEVVIADVDRACRKLLLALR